MLRFFNKPSLKLWECCKSLQLLDSWVLVGMVSPHLPEHTRQWKCHNMLAILQDASIISIFVYLQFILVDTVTHSVVSLCIRTVWVSVHEFKFGELPRVELLGLGLKDSFVQRLCIARFDDWFLMILCVLFGFPLKMLWLCCSAKLLLCFVGLGMSRLSDTNTMSHHLIDVICHIVYCTFMYFLHSIDNGSTRNPETYTTEELQKGCLCRHLLSLVVQIM